MAGGLARTLYRGAVGAGTLAALPLRGRDKRIAVFYGGARVGSLGGPLVKVGLLSQRFPERRIGFSLFYLLSNAIYLPQGVIDHTLRAGVPVALNQNGVFYPAWYPQGWEQENARMARLHAAASHVFYQSEFCRRCALRFLGARGGPAEVLYNAVDTERFTPAHDVVRRPFTFLLTGKISKVTGYRVTSAIEGLAAARRGGLDLRLTVAGAIDPDVDAAVRALAQQRGLAAAVAFTGPYTGQDAPGIYRSADAYLITKHNDPCPNVVLEALASGLPVLYAASGGVPELVGEAAGIGLPVEESFHKDLWPSPDAIADGMARIITSRETMARAARARATESFGQNPWLDRHEALFRKLVAA
jgi:glycosyltransferase involved in cell wall biosynthesis